MILYLFYALLCLLPLGGELRFTGTIVEEPSSTSRRPEVGWGEMVVGAKCTGSSPKLFGNQADFERTPWLDIDLYSGFD